VNFEGEKWDSDFGQKYEIQILVKNTSFLSSISVVVKSHQGVQPKDRLF